MFIAAKQLFYCSRDHFLLQQTSKIDNGKSKYLNLIFFFAKTEVISSDSSKLTRTTIHALSVIAKQSKSSAY